MNLLTNEQYWAAQDPQVEAIRHLNTPGGSNSPDIAARTTLARSLYNKGFRPDYWIWILGVDAGVFMLGRVSVYQGLKWLPNMFSSTVWTPALIGQPPEPQAVLVSADADDPMYKPFVPPPVPNQPPSGLVGAEIVGVGFQAINVHGTGGKWLFNDGDPLPGGHNGVPLYFHVIFPLSAFGAPVPVWTESAG